MGDVVKLVPPMPEAIRVLELERERFERWAGSVRTLDEAARTLARNDDEYVLPTTHAAWAAWQARGLMDKLDMIASDPTAL